MERSVQSAKSKRVFPRVLPEDRPFTRSRTRELENQVAGSIFTQIDTGIVKPIDFVLTDFFNMCANLVLGLNQVQAAASENLDLTAQVM